MSLRAGGIILFCYCQISLVNCVVHTLQYVYMASSEIPGLPEFVAVGMVDGEAVCHYDSNTHKMVPRQQWMEQNLEQHYWQEETWMAQVAEWAFKTDIEILKQRFNSTAGMHVFQRMYGCRWNDLDNISRGYELYVYNGEDFISLDLDNMIWVAAVPQAVSTKNRWERYDSKFQGRKVYYSEECTDWLKKYVHYHDSAPRRTVPPEVSVFLTPSSPSSVVCHATGFYPEGVNITWREDGEEILKDVYVWETLPNHDGTFQKRVVLTVSLEERRKSNYTCEVEHSGEITVRFFVMEGQARRGKPGNTTLYIIIGCVIGVLVLAGVVGAITMWRKRRKKQAPVEMLEKNLSLDLAWQEKKGFEQEPDDSAGGDYPNEVRKRVAKVFVLEPANGTGGKDYKGLQVEVAKEHNQLGGEEQPKHTNEVGEENTNEVGEKSYKAVVEKSPKAVVEKSPKAVVEKSPKAVVEKSYKEVVEKSPKGMVEKSTNEVGEKSTKQAEVEHTNEVSEERSSVTSEDHPQQA